jgi:hypothetical protein
MDAYELELVGEQTRLMVDLQRMEVAIVFRQVTFEDGTAKVSPEKSLLRLSADEAIRLWAQLDEFRKSAN